jgi:hypothetical protein
MNNDVETDRTRADAPESPEGEVEENLNYGKGNSNS